MLETNRLVLRRFMESDKNDLFDYLSDEEVVYFEPYDPFTRAKADKEAKLRTDNPSFVAICLKETNKLIGNLYFNKVEPKKINTYEIGYVFNKKYQGNGYASEAVERLLKYLFCSLETHRVIAFCNTKNIASWKLLERLKFRKEAERIENMFFEVDMEGNPLWFNSYQYAILKQEYGNRS